MTNRGDKAVCGQAGEPPAFRIGQAGRAKAAAGWALAAGMSVLLAATPAYAIPSPDLAVNFLSSAGQILGLLSVTLGGIFFGRTRGKAVAKGGKPVSARSWWLLGGLVAVAVVALVANVLQWAHATDVRNQRLEAALVRPSVENGENVGDVTLKSLSYSEQISHPAGMTTDELAALLAESGKTGKGVNLVDIREPEEKEAGYLPQFTQARYPDLWADPARYGIRKDETNVLLCFSGNRSSETCEMLASKGIPCKFVVGGYEKWLAEGHGVAGAPAESVADLRAIPAYANNSVLLDTPDVKQLVAERNALFVDVRYPGDFELGHLPDAVNMPIRKMTTADMTTAVEGLPRRPVIAPCYDKRSCFYAKILGLRLSRAGFEFLGRYTVPHEYFVPKAERAHVERWQSAQSKSLMSIVSAPLVRILRQTTEAVGSLPMAILLVVLGLRLLVMPITGKAERDQVVMRRIAPDLASLRERLAGDRVRLGRAMRALNRRHRLTPGLNMLGIVIQLPLFLAFFFAVETVARNVHAGFVWIGDMSRPDPLFLLPVFLGILVFLHLEAAAARQSTLFSFLRLAAGLLLTVVTAPLSAAVNLYLVFSVCLMALQSMQIRLYMERGSRARAKVRENAVPPGTVPHVCAITELAGRPDIAGGKASNLAEVVAAGIAVPPGFVITSEALSSGGDDLLSPQDWSRINGLWKSMRIGRAAVRSSGLNEDGDDRSYAGVFETVLGVEYDGLAEALCRVYDSFGADTASAYGHRSRETGAIIVQKMVDAEYAGVMFTEHPSRSGSILVELAEGLGDGVVDGTVEAGSYEFGRHSHKPLEGEASPIDLGPLLGIGRQLEGLFGAPQDVEWAYANGRFVILQSRAITALARKQTENRTEHLLESERHRLLDLAVGARADEPIFVQSELSELLPRPTPFSLALMEEMWQPGGTMDMACRNLGIRYDVGEDDPPFVTSVFGALYVNRFEEQRRMRRSGGFLTTLRLTRMASSIEEQFRSHFLPALDEEIRVYELVDLNKFGDRELFSMVDHVCTRFVTENYVHAHMINIAASFYFSQAERQLTKRGLSPAKYLSTLPPTVVNRAMSLLAEAKSERAARQDFIKLFGHRAPVDYEVAVPRYAEDPALIDELIASSQAMAGATPSRGLLDDLPDDRALRLCVDRAGRFQVLKEEAKHQCLREFAVIRRILLVLGARLGLDDDIFYLTRDEIAALDGGAALKSARATIEQRQEAAELFAGLPALPSELSPFDLERLSPENAQHSLNGKDVMLKGQLVAGQAPIRGRARVAIGTSLDGIESGEILITRFMHPTWAPALPRVAGIVTEIGGWLSHAAILAREYNVPTVVGARGVLDRIVTGDQVQLNPDGSIELV